MSIHSRRVEIRVLLLTGDAMAWCPMQVSQALTGQRWKGTRRAAKRRKPSHASGGVGAQEASDGDEEDDDDEVTRLPVCTGIQVTGHSLRSVGGLS